MHESGLESTTARVTLVPTEIKSGIRPIWASSGEFGYSKDDGLFEIHKILPGRYRINVELIDYNYLNVDCGEIVIVNPGVIEKDIQVPESGVFEVPRTEGDGTPIVTQGVVESCDTENGRDTFIFKVDPNGAKVRGIHIEAPKGWKLVSHTTNSEGYPVFKAPKGWTFYQSFDGRVYHFVATDRRPLPSGESEFSVTVPLEGGDAPLTSRVTFIFTEGDDFRQIIGITRRNREGYDTLGPVTR